MRETTAPNLSNGGLGVKSSVPFCTENEKRELYYIAKIHKKIFFDEKFFTEFSTVLTFRKNMKKISEKHLQFSEKCVII